MRQVSSAFTIITLSHLIDGRPGQVQAHRTAQYTAQPVFQLVRSRLMFVASDAAAATEQIVADGQFGFFRVRFAVVFGHGHVLLLLLHVNRRRCRRRRRRNHVVQLAATASRFHGHDRLCRTFAVRHVWLSIYASTPPDLRGNLSV